MFSLLFIKSIKSIMKFIMTTIIGYTIALSSRWFESIKNIAISRAEQLVIAIRYTHSKASNNKMWRWSLVGEQQIRKIWK